MPNPDDEKIPASLEKSLRKGNLNFDFLQPEDNLPVTEETGNSNRRTNSRQGKRGLFNRGRPSRPFKKIHLYFTILFCLLQLAGIVTISLSNNYLWLLFVPILLTLFLGSLIMVTILLVRPL